jgi:curved DNA-binding protein CbpA
MKWIVAALIIWGVWHFMRRPKAKKQLSPAADARAVLGVGAGADAAEIRSAHRRLMAEIHPDRGGSDDRARQANAARDLLLARLERQA